MSTAAACESGSTGQYSGIVSILRYTFFVPTIILPDSQLAASHVELDDGSLARAEAHS
jgi:hypothetical protein